MNYFLVSFLGLRFSLFLGLLSPTVSPHLSLLTDRGPCGCNPGAPARTPSPPQCEHYSICLEGITAISQFGGVTLVGELRTLFSFVLLLRGEPHQELREPFDAGVSTWRCVARRHHPQHDAGGKVLYGSYSTASTQK